MTTAACAEQNKRATANTAATQVFIGRRLRRTNRVIEARPVRSSGSAPGAGREVGGLLKVARASRKKTS